MRTSTTDIIYCNIKNMFLLPNLLEDNLIVFFNKRLIKKHVKIFKICKKIKCSITDYCNCIINL